jgi:hypothetical protein
VPSTATDEITDALFVRDGEWLVPGMPALGPWQRDELHGGAVSSLLAGSLEREGTVLARVTMDLLGRVPAAPLQLVTSDEWGSPRVRHQTVELRAGDRLVARAEGLRLPLASLELPEAARVVPEWDLPDIDESRLPGRREKIVGNVGYPSFVSHAITMKFASGDFQTVGTTTTWMRLEVPVIAGEAATGVQRAAAAADYGNGGMAQLPYDQWSFKSVDLTVQLTREPVGEWIAIVCSPIAQASGVGMGDAELHDRAGRLGQSTSSLIIEPR